MNKQLSLAIFCFCCVFQQGCMLWPYKSDFDCPIPDAEQCKSLYEVNKMTDQGKYTPREGVVEK